MFAEFDSTSGDPLFVYSGKGAADEATVAGCATIFPDVIFFVWEDAQPEDHIVRGEN